MEEIEKNDDVLEMKESLGSMMQMNTPVLDFVEEAVLLPYRLLMSRLALTVAIQVLIPAFAWREALMYAGSIAASLIAGNFVESMKLVIKSSFESEVKSQLTEIFQKDGLTIHSFSKGGNIPLFLLGHLQLTEGFDGAVSGDLISLHYRGYSIVCCNIALTLSEVEGFEDSYTLDDVQARKYFRIEDDQNVVFYGSVFMFFPGPAIEGNARLAAYSPTQYLKDLQEMETDTFVTGSEQVQERMSFFNRYHQIEGENDEDQSEAENVFSQRVKDMVLQLEWKMRAPIAVYADKNMVCLTIQDKVYDFECIHDVTDPGKELKETLYTKIGLFKNILDTIIGPEGSEYTELLGSLEDQRKSVYTPFLNPFHQLTSLEDEDIQVYVRGLAEWSTDSYRFLLHYSQEYQTACKELGSVCTMFLSELLEHEDLVQVRIWLESSAGMQLRYAVTSVVVSLFKDIWSAPGKCEVKNICRKMNEGKEELEFDIVVNPPIRKWNYSPEINRRLVAMCTPSRFRLSQLYDKKKQRELVDTFEKYLKVINHLEYDMDHIYHAAITINKGQKYGMSPEEIRLFCRWYINLMAEKMEKNGESFTLFNLPADQSST